MKRVAALSGNERRQVRSYLSAKVPKFKPADFWPYEDFSMWLHILFMLAPNLSNCWKTWLLDLIMHPQFCARDIR
jgi:hypothetical protein